MACNTVSDDMINGELTYCLYPKQLTKSCASPLAFKLYSPFVVVIPCCNVIPFWAFIKTTTAASIGPLIESIRHRNNKK